MINVLISFNTCFHLLLSYGNSPQCIPLSILVGVCIWVLGFTHEALEALMGSLEFFSPCLG